MPRTTITGDQIRDGEVKTADLGDAEVTEAKLAAAAAANVRIQDLAVTNPKLLLRDIATDKLADVYVLDGDVVDIGGTLLLTHPTIGVETFHIATEAAEVDPSAATDGIPLDGASHVAWALTDASFTSASYQGWLYTTNLGWMQIPSLSGSLSSSEVVSGTREVSGAERFALQVAALAGTSPSILKVLKAVTT